MPPNSCRLHSRQIGAGVTALEIAVIWAGAFVGYAKRSRIVGRMNRDLIKRVRSTEMGENTRDACDKQAHDTAEMLDEVWAAIDADGTYEDEDAREFLDELPLCVEFERGEPFAIVLGTGGPHVEIRGGTRHDGATYDVHVYWAGEHVVYGHASDGVQRTGEYFRSLVDEEG